MNCGNEMTGTDLNNNTEHGSTGPVGDSIQRLKDRIKNEFRVLIQEAQEAGGGRKNGKQCLR